MKWFNLFQQMEDFQNCLNGIYVKWNGPWKHSNDANDTGQSHTLTHILSTSLVNSAQFSSLSS